MASTALSREEGIGLALALVAHAALVAFLVWRPAGEQLLPPPERMTVTLSEDVGLTSTSPEPQSDAAPDAGPEIGEPAPPEPEMAEPLPRAKPEPRIIPSPAPRPVPRVVPRPAIKPVARTVPRPAPTPAARPKPPARNAAATPQRTPPRQAGASRFDSAFKSGVPGAQSTGTSRTPAAAAAGRAEQASLKSAISRQLKPRWVPPQGVDADKLATFLAWNLNPDGSLAGTPRVVRQTGVNDSNRPQAGRHAEQAIRAVQLAAPFDLPQEHYAAWKRISSFEFNVRLSQ